MPRPIPIALTEAERREVELVWNGKTRDVCTTVLPFQRLEHVDEPRKQAKASPQFALFDPRGHQVRGWINKLSKRWRKRSASSAS